MNIAGEMFNNREIASAIWLLLFLVYILSRSSVRQSLHDLLRAFFRVKLLLPFCLMLLYILIIVFALQEMGFWDKSLIKDTLFWTFGVALIMYFNADRAIKDDYFFRKTISDNLKLVLILEFLLNLYSFSLVIEIILVPVMTLLVLIHAIAQKETELAAVKSFSAVILTLIGIGLIVITGYKIINDFENFATVSNLRDFLLYPVFSIALLPFIYLMALYIQYENIFTRIDIINNHSEAVRYAKKRILASFHLNLKRLNRWSREAGILKVDNRSDVEALLRDHKSM